jgi:hypothetical protein
MKNMRRLNFEHSLDLPTKRLCIPLAVVKSNLKLKLESHIFFMLIMYYVFHRLLVYMFCILNDITYVVLCNVFL